MIVQADTKFPSERQKGRLHTSLNPADYDSLYQELILLVFVHIMQILTHETNVGYEISN